MTNGRAVFMANAPARGRGRLPGVRHEALQDRRDGGSRRAAEAGGGIKAKSKAKARKLRPRQGEAKDAAEVKPSGGQGRRPGGGVRSRSPIGTATHRRKPARATHPAAKLVIVESPAKARTVGRFLGRGYEVRASVGHVRDLLESQLSVDIEHDFAPTYRVPDEKKEVVKALKAAAAEASEVYLATDPDREGEAIAWHLLEAAGIPPERARRVVFHEITKNAIAEAFGHSRDIDMQLVDAQQARRILDRLVGYQVSPLLWDARQEPAVGGPCAVGGAAADRRARARDRRVRAGRVLVA